MERQLESIHGTTIAARLLHRQKPEIPNASRRLACRLEPAASAKQKVLECSWKLSLSQGRFMACCTAQHSGSCSYDRQINHSTDKLSAAQLPDQQFYQDVSLPFGFIKPAPYLLQD